LVDAHTDDLRMLISRGLGLVGQQAFVFKALSEAVEDKERARTIAQILTDEIGRFEFLEDESDENF
ncbi:hypothetical protein ACOI1H_22740, partial [Loktanella sp. DJP18]|uniref:hypothetical protein n=1 Tax=Loktanella sp. DJP18 TaxID=3409788 RepID=UPI003BB61015